jgi:hypothetical protein
MLQTAPAPEPAAPAIVQERTALREGNVLWDDCFAIVTP